MSDDYYIKAERLLDIISNLADQNINQLATNPPVVFHQNGEITFSEELLQELSKSENSDLNDWAYKNIKDLF
jgi:hypothetical protein